MRLRPLVGPASIRDRIVAPYSDRLVVEYEVRYQEPANAKGELSSEPEQLTPAALHPAAMTEMTRLLTILAEHLPNLDPREDRAMFDAFRSLIHRVVIHDREDGDVDCEIIGTISPLLGGKPGVSVVAEEGLEPPTRGL